jgi:hypothetical protein
MVVLLLLLENNTVHAFLYSFIKLSKIFRYKLALRLYKKSSSIYTYSYSLTHQINKTRKHKHHEHLTGQSQGMNHVNKYVKILVSQ